jgi:hypothetical protein
MRFPVAAKIALVIAGAAPRAHFSSVISVFQCRRQTIEDRGLHSRADSVRTYENANVHRRNNSVHSYRHSLPRPPFVRIACEHKSND